MYKFTRIAAPLAMATALVLPLAGCSSEKYAVGDCVTAESGITNDKMEKAECRTATLEDQLNGDYVYQVTQVLEYEATCPTSTNITFDDEPADATYCLSEY